MGDIIEDASLRNRYYVFRNREEAGERLAEWLRKIIEGDAIVLAIPAGGVPVGKAISKRLSLPFGVIIVRKIPIPGETEAGFGALSFDGEVFINSGMVKALGITREEIEEQKKEVMKQIKRRVEIFGKGRPFPELKGKTAVLVDDGLATGYTMLAAISSVRKRGAKKVIVAVPTSPLSAARFLQSEVEMLVALNIREAAVFAVADAYETWRDLSEEEVLELLKDC